MIDKDLVGMGWMDILDYEVVRKEEDDSLENNKGQKDKVIPKCQLEIKCHADDIEARSEIMAMPPLRILSFDIECAAEQGFPDPERHQVIQIACVCKTSTRD